MSLGLIVVASLATLIFPGLGQGLAGRRIRMVAFAAFDVVATLAVLVSVWFALVNLTCRIVASIDAWRCLRGGDSARRANWTLTAIAVLIGAVGMAASDQVIEGFKIPSSSMYPTLVIGDHVYVDKLSVRWKPPERGEVMVFTQPCSRYTFIKRVIALPGDTVEVRCSIVYVNGKALPATLVDAHASYQDHDESRGEWIARQCSRYRESHGGHSYETFSDAERPERGTTTADVHDFPRRERAFLPPSCTQSGFYEPKPGAVTQPIGKIVETKLESEASACEPQLHFVVPAGGFFVMGDNRNNANDSRNWGVVPNELVIGRPVGIYYSNIVEGGWSRFGALE
ncbi:MAG: signal peptidase I [Kofleriaceae bacterium]|nr:signal peptidase I [Kofleriaceae bacterium]